MSQILSNYSNLTQRIITALLGGALIITAMLYSPVSFWLLFLLIGILTQYEFYKLLGLSGNSPLIIYGTVCGATLNILTYLIESGQMPFKLYYLIVPILTATFFIKLFKPNDDKPFQNLGFTFLGIIYVAVPFALVNELVIDGEHFKPMIMLGILIILWVNDSGAYFSGTLFGKRKLFERISPKKTWEGFIGGAICSLLASLIFSRFYPEIELWKWLVIATIIFSTGTLGDLVESLFKRSIDIKDSGSIIPGHGGFLDRFDGLLLSLPFILTFLKIVV